MRKVNQCFQAGCVCPLHIIQNEQQGAQLAEREDHDPFIGLLTRILLRRGNLVSGITNKSPAAAVQQSPTGTASDKVNRSVNSEESR